MMLGLSFGRTITAMDAPEHTRYRRIFQKAFLPTIVAQWGERLVDPVVTTLLAAFAARGTADLVPEFTQNYPFGVIYRMLNLPPEDTAIFHKLAVAQTNLYLDTRHAIEAGKKLGAYFAGMLADRRSRPGEDLVSTLAQAEVDGEHLPDEVIISFLRQLMNAGGDTTFRATSTLLAQLLLNPDQFDTLLKNRALLLNAIDEALRWDTPVLMMYRISAKDSILGGVHIPAGSMLQVSQGAANRDPAHFPDPDKFDIFRDNKSRPLRFGTGPHVCIGQHLARLEMTRAVTALMDRLLNLRLDPDKPAPVMHGSELRSPDHIFVKFDRRAERGKIV
jgi:cytochrome P450